MCADFRLMGCNPEPIGSYLKALGVLRIVTEQVDPDARGWWDGEVFVLECNFPDEDKHLDDEGKLLKFLVDKYRPSSIITPWNVDFWGEETIDSIRRLERSAYSAAYSAAEGNGAGPSNGSDRFSGYLSDVKKTMSVMEIIARRASARAGGRGVVRDKLKKEILRSLRSELSPRFVSWFDSVIALVGDDEKGGANNFFVGWLGSGGNNGRYDLGKNFALALADLFAPDTGSAASTGSQKAPDQQMALWKMANTEGEEVVETDHTSHPDTHTLLRASLFDEVGSNEKLLTINRVSISMLNIGLAGGVNSEPFSSSNEHTYLASPWDLVLALEGSICLASEVVHRSGRRDRRGSSPFFFSDSGLTVGRFREAKPHGEMWLPVWTKPATYAEVRHMFGEGRLSLRGRPARSGIDAVEAVMSLGVDRGITSFVVSKINEDFGGNARLIAARGRVFVHENPDVRLIQAVSAWEQRVERVMVRGGKNVPSWLWDLLYRCRDAEMDALASGRPSSFQSVLIHLAEMERAFALLRCPGRCLNDKSIAPITGLVATQWLDALDDDSPELRLAAALASARDYRSDEAGLMSAKGHSDDGFGWLAHLLRPIEVSGNGRAQWREEGLPIIVLDGRPVDVVLAQAAEVRAREVDTAETHSDGVVISLSGPDITYSRGVLACPEDVRAFVCGEVDYVKLQKLLAGLLLLDWRRDWSSGKDVEQHWVLFDKGCFEDHVTKHVPLALALIAPFLHGYRKTGEIRLLPGPDWVAQMAAGKVRSVATDALERLERSSFVPVVTSPEQIVLNLEQRRGTGKRIAAISMLRMSGTASASLLDRVAVSRQRLEELTNTHQS